VAEHQPHLIFSRLVQQIFDTCVKIVVRLINVHKGRPPPILWNNSAFLCCLTKECNKKPAKNFTAFLFE
jgi:hypothetical protein